ncbi:MAG: hypothetical protein K0U78_14320 [Actinomycetia bacterium]|nr:hypothetical protein [Actinomycetes bacterium]
MNEKNLKCKIDKPVNCMQGCKLTPSEASMCCCNTKKHTFCSKKAKCENITSGSDEKESQKEKHADKGHGTHHRKHFSSGKYPESEIRIVRRKQPNKGKRPDERTGLGQGNVSDKDKSPAKPSEKNTKRNETEEMHTEKTRRPQRKQT